MTVTNSIISKLFTPKSFAFGLLATSLLGVHIVSINLGAVQLSPYRLLLLLSPIVFLKTRSFILRDFQNSRNFVYFQFLLFWLFYSIIPLLWINDFSAWFRIFTLFFSGVITTLFLGMYIKKKSDVVVSLRIVEAIAALLSIIGLYEILTGNYFILSEENLEYYRTRSIAVSTIGYRVPVSVFSNPNDYGLFLMFSVGISFALSKIKQTKKGKLLSTGFTVLFIFLLVATQSRSAFIGLLICIFSYFLLSVKSKNFFFVLIGSMLFTVILLPVLSANIELYEALFTIDVSGGGDASRINLIKNGIIFLEETYFFGVGLGNIEYSMQRFGVFSTGSNTSIHNWWMEILVSSGIVVFFFYLYIFSIASIRLFKAARFQRDKVYRILAIVFFCLMMGFVVACMGSSSLMRNEWLWPLMALIMCFINIKPYPKNN